MELSLAEECLRRRDLLEDVGNDRGFVGGDNWANRGHGSESGQYSSVREVGIL